MTPKDTIWLETTQQIIKTDFEWVFLDEMLNADVYWS